MPTAAPVLRALLLGNGAAGLLDCGAAVPVVCVALLVCVEEAEEVEVEVRVEEVEIVWARRTAGGRAWKVWSVGLVQVGLKGAAVEFQPQQAHMSVFEL